MRNNFKQMLLTGVTGTDLKYIPPAFDTLPYPISDKVVNMITDFGDESPISTPQLSEKNLHFQI